MNKIIGHYLPIAVFMVTAFLCTTASAEKPSACAGVEKVCNKSQTYDKTIEGKQYSCYDCSQTLCSGGGNSIVGSQSSSVCSEKRSKIVTKTEASAHHPIGEVYVAPRGTKEPGIRSKVETKSKENPRSTAH